MDLLAWSLCAFQQARRLSLPHETAWVLGLLFLPKAKTLLEGSADHEFPHQANRRGIVFSEREGNFSGIKTVIEISNFSVMKRNRNVFWDVRKNVCAA